MIIEALEELEVYLRDRGVVGGSVTWHVGRYSNEPRPCIVAMIHGGPREYVSDEVLVPMILDLNCIAGDVKSALNLMDKLDDAMTELVTNKAPVMGITSIVGATQEGFDVREVDGDPLGFNSVTTYKVTVAGKRPARSAT